MAVYWFRGKGHKFSTNSSSRYLLEKLQTKLKKKCFSMQSLPFLGYLLWVPSYAETCLIFYEEPPDLQDGAY